MVIFEYGNSTGPLCLTDADSGRAYPIGSGENSLCTSHVRWCKLIADVLIQQHKEYT